MLDLTIIGKLIRQRRKSMNMTIEDLAEKSQSSISLISMIERGRLDNIKIQKLNDIALALNLNIKDFFDDNELKDPAVVELNNYLAKLSKEQQHEVATLLLRLINL
ncbi:helix-turn-helix domain-containing protein [Pediococcus acidilactici]|uniref:helix-turn-helix domain-containing protein n=1 Tax=Pediococcus acidilactici TaxID=1254 RepID=UPI0013219392|nr:helix-turn-helix transcriptional regulator [Pediococcus acidilactici]KAF0363714.1 helix-turn-helix domain-containing protein [Pediococcus acidilactici]KAF0367470.1 helix-turn-helix domain-containing protein [Pediococcus acidilactici]KAF0418432.1 helix-turn-helix domain-containing protein [Pediococcus acidilactici]KAF0421423.1 helix-turn-helix domain-containing protein [Pediococcus acidilactici]KAF0473972.1 helix-turn-helix domain-containing protein [Pediococcus acidilactici]